MINHLINAVATITILQWTELALIAIGACSVITFCWILLQDHPVMGAICGLLLVICLPMLIGLLLAQLSGLQSIIVVILLIIMMVSVTSYLTRQQ